MSEQSRSPLLFTPLNASELKSFDFAKIQKKLEILADAAKYDASCASSGSYRKRDPNGMGNAEGMGICHSYTPDGRCVSLLKILLTNFCIYDCKFCINRITSDTARAQFTPDEVVQLTLEFYRRNYIEGLFLSSGIIKSVDDTMLLLIEVARKLRKENRFGGYIHLKVVPGASPELIEQAGFYADRVSANIELAVQQDLDHLAPAKSISETTSSMLEIKNKYDDFKDARKRFRSAPNFAPAGQSTQMIIGATPTPDRDILKTSSDLYSGYSLRRVYYSAYSPIPHADSALPISQPHLVRENRLYQADWLLRFYGFTHQELTDDSNPNLDLDVDPKVSWALRNRHEFPIDVNKAPREQLLRVPGLGVKNVERILKVRKHQNLTLENLRRMRVPVKRAQYFLLTADYNPGVHKLDELQLKQRVKTKSEQLSLFETLDSAASGEV